jgi:hypothetical protein
MARERTPEQESVRGYLLAQGERASWLELWPRVMEPRLQLLEALRGLTDEQARFRPAEGEWSALEVACHLLEYSRSVRATIEALAQGRHPEQRPELGVLTGPGDARLEDVRRGLIEEAVALTVLANARPEPPPLEATVEHDFFGPLHCKAWFLFQRVHDADHVGQLAAIKAAPGYPA